MEKLNEGFVMDHEIIDELGSIPEIVTWRQEEKEIKKKELERKGLEEREETETKTYYFEYGISTQTARLLVSLN